MKFLQEFFIFIRKQAASAIFGGLMLFFLVLTRYFEIPGIHRYDLLFIIALLIQVVLIVFKFEHLREVAAIIIFHIFAMVMEIYKTSIGSWIYPEPAILAIATVPLFSGFMYSAVGSYISRAWRINQFRFENMPSRLTLFVVAVLIYANFFTNYFIYDIRYFIFGLLIVVFWKTKLHAKLTNREFTFHPLVTNGLLALFVWLAEQIGTFVRVWVYPSQMTTWIPVSFRMLTSWYLLLIFSFIIIYFLQRKPAK